MHNYRLHPVLCEAVFDVYAHLFHVIRGVPTQVHGDTGEELINVFMGVPNEEETYHDLVEHPVIHQHSQVPPHAKPLALSARVVHLQVQLPWQGALLLLNIYEGTIDDLNGGVVTHLHVVGDTVGVRPTAVGENAHEVCLELVCAVGGMCLLAGVGHGKLGLVGTVDGHAQEIMRLET